MHWHNRNRHRLISAIRLDNLFLDRDALAWRKIVMIVTMMMIVMIVVIMMYNDGSDDGSDV